MNNELYVNLNTVTLYKTPLFNKTDSILFESENDRDNYFNSLPSQNKLLLTEFTDLYENRPIVLPYNYLDLKKYNTMKLYYNDGLGHEKTYYCNVDNYIYIGTKKCVPIYRIDYFLTFGYLLKNKTFDMIFERRSVKNKDVNRNMKCDNIVAPRLTYKEHEIFPINNSHRYFIIFLNNSVNPFTKVGINFKVLLAVGNSGGNVVYETIDNYTIGSLVCIADEEGLPEVLKSEPSEYIERILEMPTTPLTFLDSAEMSSLNTNHKLYLTTKTEYTVTYCQEFYNLNENKSPKIFNKNYKHKILNRLTTEGVVVQGIEFDKNNFSNDYLTKYDKVHIDIPLTNGSGIYFINALDRIYAVPLGYKGELFNRNNIISWNCCKEFPYILDYTNSLAYKEAMEKNNRAAQYAERVASIQQFYQRLSLENSNMQAELQKTMNQESYRSQINELNYRLNLSSFEFETTTSGSGGFIEDLVANFKGIFSGSALKNTTTYKSVEKNINDLTLKNQRKLLNNQIKNLDDATELQKEANQNNYQFQCDSIAATRDNTIANLALENKYNALQAGSYREADFSMFTNFFYSFSIDTNDGDFTIYNSFINYYNINGIYTNYQEKWNTNEYYGTFYDYIKGSFNNISQDLFNDIDYDVYIELAGRISEGVRIWHKESLQYFGNLSIDNMEDFAEPYNTLSDNRKIELNDYLLSIIYNGDIEYVEGLIEASAYSTIEKNYLKYLNKSYLRGFYWGEPEGTEQTLYMSAMESIVYSCKYDELLTKEETLDYLKELYSEEHYFKNQKSYYGDDGTIKYYYTYSNSNIYYTIDIIRYGLNYTINNWDII